MSCAINSGYLTGCKNSIGGLKIVRLANIQDIQSYVESNGVITDIIMKPGKVFFAFELPKGTCSYVITPVVSLANGTALFSEAVTLVFNKMMDSTSIILQAMIKSTLVMIAEDMNGNAVLLGRTEGVDVVGGEITSGVVSGDRNGYTLNFAGEEPVISHLSKELIRKFYDPVTAETYYILVNDGEYLTDEAGNRLTYI